MKRKSNLIPRLATVLAILFSLVFCLRFVPFFKIDSYSVDKPMTWSMEKAILDIRGRNLFAVDLLARRRAILKNSILEDLKFDFHCNNLNVSLSYPEEGALVISNEGRFFFCSERLLAVNAEDYPSLSQMYPVVKVQEAFLDHMEKYGIPEDFAKKLKALCYAETHSALITSAEYDNNNLDVFSGILTLNLDGISAVLEVRENKSEDMVLQSIELIESEYADSKDRLFEVVSEYVLEGTTLTRRKR